MSKKVRYTGTADVREVNASDFKRNDVDDQNKVTWDASNNFVAEVSDSAAEFLIGLEGNDFVDVDEESSKSAKSAEAKAAAAGTEDGTNTEGDVPGEGAGIGDGPTTTTGGSTAGGDTAGGGGRTGRTR